MSDEKTNASDFPAVKKARDAAAQKLSYYRRMSSMAYQITEPERTAAELQRLRAENERLRRRLSEIDAALYLASEDVLWFHSKEDEGADLERWLVGVINCNDAFYYATADGEAIAPGEFLLARDVYDTYGYHGLIALAALRRKKEPLEPLRTPEYYAALKSLETDAAVEGER